MTATEPPTSVPAVDLTCRLEIVAGRPVLQLQGEIDLATVPLLRDRLAKAIGAHAGHELLVDLDGVTVLDDTGLGVLLGAAGRARERGGDVVLVCSTPRLTDRLDATGFSRAVEVRHRLAPG